MSNQERYWLNAAVYILLSSMFSGFGPSMMNSIAVVGCYALSTGYFVAMIVAPFRGKSK